MSLLICPAVGNFIIGPDRDVDVDGSFEQPSILLTTLDAAVFSADVGGEVRGRLIIWCTVNFDEEKVLRVSCLQPCVTCFFKFLRATMSVHDVSSQGRSSSPNIFTTTSLAGGYDELEISCTSLHEGHGSKATSSHERKRRAIQSEHKLSARCFHWLVYYAVADASL